MNASQAYLKAAQATLEVGNGLGLLDAFQIAEYDGIRNFGYPTRDERCLLLCLMAAIAESEEK